MINWYAITSTRLEHPEYQALTTAERLYTEYIISEYSLRGPFYKSDLEVAMTLGLSVDKVRHARRWVGKPTKNAVDKTAKCAGKDLSTGLGWVIYEPGWKRGHEALATRYIDVPVATWPEGAFFASVPRFTFESLLHEVRLKTLKHQDVVVWLVLSYLFWRFRGAKKNHDFFVMKDELRSLCGVAAAEASVQRLHDIWAFTDGSHLFEYTDQHRRMDFTKWVWLADPSEDENARQIHEQHRADIAQRVKEAKNPTPQRRKPPAKTVSR